MDWVHSLSIDWKLVRSQGFFPATLKLELNSAAKLWAEFEGKQNKTSFSWESQSTSFRCQVRPTCRLHLHCTFSWKPNPFTSMLQLDYKCACSLLLVTSFKLTNCILFGTKIVINCDKSMVLKVKWFLNHYSQNQVQWIKISQRVVYSSAIIYVLWYLLAAISFLWIIRTNTTE